MPKINFIPIMDFYVFQKVDIILSMDFYLCTITICRFSLRFTQITFQPNMFQKVNLILCTDSSPSAGTKT